MYVGARGHVPCRGERVWNMRLRILSDLHLEFHDWTPPTVDADAVVLAGDIDVGVDGLTWARQNFASLPVVYVPGNHEFYGKRWERALASLRDVARRLDIALLDGDEAIIDGGTLAYASPCGDGGGGVLLVL